jgi:hypothetical protein
MFDDFIQPEQQWTQTCIGGGYLSISNSVLRMGFASAQQGRYTDAQIDDYGERARSAFPWRPPLRMEVCARSSLPAATLTTMSGSSNFLHGTAGFGFWNYPFSVRGDILTLPEAIWFFYASPPSDMTLVPDSVGWGWKAQVVHSLRADVFAAVLPTALATGWARWTGQTRPAVRWLQRLSGTHEVLLSVDMTTWHTYALEWRKETATFWIDSTLVLHVPQPPMRPLGFVAWLDNQYAMATPQGVLHFGTVASGPQWFELDSVRIEPC